MSIKPSRIHSTGTKYVLSVYKDGNMMKYNMMYEVARKLFSIWKMAVKKIHNLQIFCISGS